MVLVLGLFAWRGDLRLGSELGDAQDADRLTVAAGGDSRSPERVVVRRTANGEASMPHAERGGRVCDAAGYLLVGAEIVTSGVDPRANTTALTDAAGRFRVDLPVHTVSDVLVRAEGQQPTWLRTTAFAPDELLVQLQPNAPWDVAPAPAPHLPSLRGEGVVRAGEGEVVAGALVHAADTDCWARTDEIGRFQLPLPSLRVELSAYCDVLDRGNAAFAGGLCATRQLFVSPRPRGAVEIPDLVVETAGSIRGALHDGLGAPAAGVPVAVRGNGLRRTVVTGADGSFGVGGLAAGDYRVAPFAWRGAIARPIDVRVDRAVVACDLQMHRIPERRLRVVDEQGGIRQGLWVAANLFGMRRGVGQTDADGLVTLPLAEDAEDIDFEVRTEQPYVACEVRGIDADREPLTLVIAAP